jgi:hypothetical protein
MRFLVRFLLLCLLPMAGWAQSSLPPYQSDVRAYWHDCIGTITFLDGAKYVGEFRRGVRHGEGIYYSLSGV